MDWIRQNKLRSVAALVVIALALLLRRLAYSTDLFVFYSYAAAFIIGELVGIILMVRFLYSLITKLLPTKYGIWMTRISGAVITITTMIGVGWLLRHYILALHAILVINIVKRSNSVDILLSRVEQSLWNMDFSMFMAKRF